MTQRTELIWIVGCALVVIVGAVDIIHYAQGTASAAYLWHRDFSNLWAGGRLIDAGDYATLYDRHTFTAWQTSAFGDFGARTFSYPPTLFPLAQLATVLPYRPALIAWLTATAALFGLAAKPLWPKGAGPVWLAALTPAALLNISMGHMGFLFGAIWLAIFHQLDRRPVLAGSLIGLFVMKPQLAILLPLVLLLRGEWRAIAAAAASAMAMIASSALVYGLAPWKLFLFGAVGTQASFIDPAGAGFARLSTSAATAVLGLGGGWPMAMLVQVLLAIIGVAALVRCRSVPTPQLGMLAATATFLVLPYALAYDLTVVSLGALSLMVDRSASSPDRRLASIGFVAPQVGIVFAYLGAPVMSLMLLALLVAQYRAFSGRAVPAGAAAAHSA